jgi:putative oxidoreductase
VNNLDRWMHPLARFLLVVLFPFSAIDKIVNWPLALQQANSSFLPHGDVLLAVGMALEFVAPALILLNWYAKPAAFALAGFCAVTAILYHNFWAYDGFWNPQGGPARDHFWEFLKNFGLVGGLIYTTLGARMQQIGYALHTLAATDTRPLPRQDER